MKTHLVLCLVLWMPLFPAHGATVGMDNGSVSDEEKRVLAVEDEYVAAEVNRDEATLRRIIDDRFVFNRSNGKTSGKAALIADLLELKMTGQTLSERTVLLEGNIALIFGTAELRFASEGKEESRTLWRYTSTYVNRDGQWRYLALQMVRRPPSP